MDTILILGTKQGVIIAFKQDNRWTKATHHLNSQRVTAITISRARVLAGTTEGLYRSSLPLNAKSDLEANLSKLEWEPLQAGIGTAHIRYLATHPGEKDRILAGSEPAEIYISEDGGNTWRNCPEVTAMRERYSWSLPYSPQAGCVRGFAFQDKRAYAAVEDGCVLVSYDRGESWQLAEGSSGNPDHLPSMGRVHSDVHSVEVHPSSADRVVAPTGGGLYRSPDGGLTWTNLYRCYTRAAWLDPKDPNHIVFGPADSVDRGGRIELTRDGGQTWINASDGLNAPWRGHMVERFAHISSQLLAVLSNGQIAISALDRPQWEFILPDLPFVHTATEITVR
jgi:hypothetical protein